MIESTDRISLLVVDDDEPLRTRLARALTRHGYDVVSAATSSEALALARAQPPEYAVIDLRLGADSGLELVRALLALEPAMKIVVLTGYGSIATAVEAMRLGAVDYLTKPADAQQVLRALGGKGEPAGDDAGTPSLDRAEWEHLQRVLSDCEGNVSEAARRLGLHRRSLQRKLAKAPPKR